MPYKDKGKKAAHYKLYYETHKEKCRLTDAAYRAAHKEENRAYREAHREERSIYNRIWAKTHPKERSIHNHTYQKAHPQQNAEGTRRYKARRRGAIIGSIDITAIKIRDQMRCAICQRKVAEKDFSLDHSIPLFLGGSHSQENVRVAHRHCNIKRGAGKLPVQLVLC